MPGVEKGESACQQTTIVLTAQGSSTERGTWSYMFSLSILKVILLQFLDLIINFPFRSTIQLRAVWEEI